MKFLMNANAEITWGQQAIKTGLQIAAVMVGAIVATGTYGDFVKAGVLNVLWNPFWTGLLSSLVLFGVDNVGTRTHQP